MFKLLFPCTCTFSAAAGAAMASVLHSDPVATSALKRALSKAEKKMAERAQTFARQADDGHTSRVLSGCSDKALHLGLEALRLQVRDW